MLAKINKTDAQWLVNEYAPKRGYRINSDTFGTFLRAYNLMKGTNKEVNCFSCEGRTIAAIAKSMYDQHEEEIKTIATKTTRKKK